MQSASIWLVAAVLAAAVAASSARGDEWQPGVASAQNSRLLAQAFAAQLKTALTQAMHEEGAAAAIYVGCCIGWRDQLGLGPALGQDGSLG